ncbi:hypothetical protein [Paracholeplasma manati]|uniref:hypothetical protein n=1 Tax=Paracholeplasma manati TaxID=591373 RepID=UPI00240858BD|nr:hypothetical protein [Paracholeplasma manati]MDG0887899.1 hypothetical protein [Paracholeplasma manati]
MIREDLLKEHILTRFKSVRSFSLEADIPYTTMATLLKSDIGKAKVPTVIKICDTLGIDISSLINGTIKEIKDLVSPQQVFLEKYHKLNFLGKARVESYIDGLLNSETYTDRD